MSDYSNKNKEKIKGVKIEAFNICMIIASCIVFLILIHVISCASLKYKQFVTQTEDYVSCEQTAVMLRQNSDYLTEQAQQFVQSTDTAYMQAYVQGLDSFNSLKSVCNTEYMREHVNESAGHINTREVIETDNSDEDVNNAFKETLADFDKATESEMYAVRLTAEATVSDLNTIPYKIRSITLKEEDTTLDKEEMLEKARGMMLGMDYQELKMHINTDLDHVFSAILNNMKKQQNDNIKTLNKIHLNLYIFIGILFIMTAVIYTATTTLIVRPLKQAINRIKEHDTLEIVGSRELKYLAITYNEIYDMNAANEAMLIHKAEHDPLTGVLNRGAFDNLMKKLCNTTETVTLILLDVDRFKYINDNGGHETGDRILQKVAKLLTITFRSRDFIIRLGGDEFAVIILGDIKGKTEMLEKRINKINKMLLAPNDGLPPISLSAGAACSNNGFSKKLYRQADQALYYVKNHGRNGLSFY